MPGIAAMTHPILLRRLGAVCALLAVGGAAALPAWAAKPPGADDKAAATAEPSGDWRVGPVAGKDGGFAYCLAESRYDNGQTLIVTRSARDEFNVGLGVPGARLTKGSAWKVKLSVDGALSRERQAVAPDPDMLVIANGTDDRLFDALIHGDVLTIEGPSDTAAFRLKGAAKALRDLRGCVERARAGQPAKTLGRIGGDKPDLPPLLRKLLAEAGFKKVGLLPVSAAPPGHGVVDTVWRIGPVTSGLGESRGASNPSLSTLSEEALARLRPRCGADAEAKQGSTDTLPGGGFRTVTVTCGGSHISLLFNLGRGGLFRSFFFEAPEAEAAEADRQRDAIADVLKRLANS